MTKYVALLRGINVGGNAKVSMDDLRKSFSSLGFKNVKTFINSGNVIFESDYAIKVLDKKINEKVSKSIGNFKTIVRTQDSLKRIANQFSKIKIKNDEKTYVIFLSEKVKIEENSLKQKGVELIKTKDTDFICITRMVNGKHEFPNLLVEKQTKILSTTRNWNTVRKLSEL